MLAPPGDTSATDGSGAADASAGDGQDSSDAVDQQNADLSSDQPGHDDIAVADAGLVVDSVPDLETVADSSEVFVEPDLWTDAPPAAICITNQDCPLTGAACATTACVLGKCSAQTVADGSPCAACGLMPSCQGGVCTVQSVYWQKTYPSPGLDDVRAVTRASDGSYYLVGERKVAPGSQDILLVRVLPTGNLAWEITFSFAPIEVVTAATLDKTGVLIAGHFSDGKAGSWDAQLVRVDLQGKLLWRKAFATPSSDRLFALTAALDGSGWLAAGERGPSGAPQSVADSNVWALRVDVDGSQVFSTTYGETLDQIALAVAATADGDWVLAGQTRTGSEPADALALRIDANGKALWQKTWPTDTWNRFGAVAVLQSGNLVFGGTFRGPGDKGAYDAWLVRTDADGAVLTDEKSHYVSGINRVASLAATATEAVDWLALGSSDPESLDSEAARAMRASWTTDVKGVACNQLGGGPQAMLVQGHLRVVAGRSGSKTTLGRMACVHYYCATKCPCSNDTPCAQSFDGECGGTCGSDWLATHGMPCGPNSTCQAGGCVYAALP